MAGSTPDNSADRPQRPAPLWLLALLTLSGTLAMHIFVPALPRAAKDLGVGSSAMQMTVSLYIVGLAVGQLLYGPLSDRFGRRSVLMTGLTLYVGAGVAALLAPEIYTLIAARLFQALGGCAGLVLGRAIVRDTALPQEAARRLALMNLMVTLGPGAAPIVGGAMATTLGWRSIFVLLVVLGIVNLAFTWRLVPETGVARPASGGTPLAQNYRRLLGSLSFWGYAVGGGCATTSMYAFIASAPFIFVRQLHRPDYEVGLYIAALVSGVWLGSVIASRVVTRVAVDKLLVRANLASALAAAVFLAAVLSGHLSVATAVAPMFVFTVGAGIASPVALTQAISVNPHVTGTASGLYGFTQMVVGALCTGLAGIGSNPALSSALVLTVAGAIGQMSFLATLRRQRTARGP